MKKAIVIGATSGIGKALTLLLLSKGYQVGITGRRIQSLVAIQDAFPNNIQIQQMDIQQTKVLDDQCATVVNRLGGVDLFIICSGIGEINKNLDASLEQDVIKTNVLGFTQLATWAFRFFQTQGHGHIVNISSIAGLRGSADAPSYSATKAFQINYAEGLQIKAHKLGLPIFITDVRPGFVDTAMAKGDGLFWVAPVEKAAKQIFASIEQKKRTVYITRRWQLIAAVLKCMPFGMFKRI